MKCQIGLMKLLWGWVFWNDTSKVLKGQIYVHQSFVLSIHIRHRRTGIFEQFKVYSWILHCLRLWFLEVSQT